jgi:hypothetical protein
VNVKNLHKDLLINLLRDLRQSRRPPLRSNSTRCRQSRATHRAQLSRQTASPTMPSKKTKDYLWSHINHHMIPHNNHHKMLYPKKSNSI